MSEIRRRNKFVDYVLDWPIEEITNQNLLRDKVKLIPTRFSYINHYLKSFRYPLLEEARAELASRLNAVCESTWVGISVKKSSATVELLHDNEINFSCFKYGAEHGMVYVPSIGDIILLSTAIPKDDKELNRGVLSSCLAAVSEVGIGDDGRNCKAMLGTSGSTRIKGDVRCLFAVFLMNITKISQIWTSLNVDGDAPPHSNMDLVKKTLCYESLVQKQCSCSHLQIEDVLDEKLLMKLKAKLNETQIDAVHSTVSAIRCVHSLSIQEISGLPGTGKTRVVSTILWVAKSLKCRLLVCSPTIFSVVELASHFLKFVEGFDQAEIVLFNDSSKELSDILPDKFLDILNFPKKNIIVPIATEREWIESFCIEKYLLFFCTVSSLSILQSLKGSAPIDLLIINDAAQVKECESIGPLQINGLRHVLLVGNDYESPSRVASKILEGVGFGRSLFERLGSLGLPRKHFSTQYRMHPSISSFPNKNLFDGKLLDGLNVMHRNYSKCYLPEHIYCSYSFLDVAEGREIPNENGENFKNVVEAAIICKILVKLFQAWLTSGTKLSIGVITPYEAQAQIIQEMLTDKIKSNCDFSLCVRSFDGISSNEEDIIIISTVRCNYDGSIGLLSNHYHTTVSLTRARNCLWIVGNGCTLARSHSIWQELVFDAKERGCFFNVAEDKNIAGVISKVKRELNELDHLLNHNSALLNGTKWKILFSDDFKRSFVALKTIFSKQLVVGFLLRLASGWRPKRRCLYSLNPPLYKYVKQYRVHGLYLVCTIDIHRDSHFIQVLRVWDVLPLVEIPILVAKLEKMISLYSTNYMDCCMMEKCEGDLVVPMTWNICSDFIKYKEPQSSPCYTDTSKVSNLKMTTVCENLLLMKFYSLSCGNVKHLLTGCDGKELELPFILSDLELEIIRFPKSAFVLGRSGTGKTIVSAVKLMQREQEYFLAFNGISSDNYSSHCNKGFRNYAVQGENALRQIFVTVNPHLCSSMKNYITRLKRIVSGGEIQGDINEVQMHEVGDYLSLFSDIPDSFIDIPQRHFPLVISLQKFLLMLDGSLSSSFFDRFHDLKVLSDDKRSIRSDVIQQHIRRKEVDFQSFLTRYWPKKFTGKLDPLLVFTQIISYIKGGFRWDKTAPAEKMTEEEYVNLSERSKSTISSETRVMIYKIYREYEKKKLNNREYDISDFVIDLHCRLRDEQYGGAMVDFVYIDEVQDFTLNQLSLFKYICSNVREGFLFSGDTAQTITKGVDFRFQDIRSMFYRDFLDGSERLPELFQLCQNFRTHSGILNLAQTVLTLLYRFFPASVDKLKSETFLAHGEVPVLIEYCEADVLKNMFGSSGIHGNSFITFGAQQVILVRDDNAKQKVIDQIGSNALVLTILECKGLEFHDVLLFNFFENSPLEDHWRAFCKFMDSKILLDSDSSIVPIYDNKIYSVLCAELKQLYVAITRAKERLWIFERTSFAKPLFDYWKKLGLVQLRNLDLSFIGSIAVPCTLQEWNERGQKFFNEKNYEMASLCFKRSGDVYRENWAKAASFEVYGDRNRDINSLCEAAKIYEKLGKMESYVSCIIKSGNYTKAGEIYLKKFHEPRYEDAGDCFSLAGSWSDAASCYAHGRCISKCLSACQKGQLFEFGWEFLKKCSGSEEYDQVDYLKSWVSDIQKLSINKFVEFTMAFPEDGFNLLLEKKNFVEVSIVERTKGNLLQLAHLLERAKDYEKSSMLFLFCIAIQTHSVVETNCNHLKPFDAIEKLVHKAKYLGDMVSSSFGRYVNAETDFLTDNSCSISNFLQHIKMARKFENVTVETFAVWKILEAYLKLGNNQFCDDCDADFIRMFMHLEDSFFDGYCSIQILFFVWDIWKQRISLLFKFLCSVGSLNEGKYEIYRDLCQKYFGVLKLDGQDGYVAVNGGASWLNGKESKFLYRKKEKVYMTGRVFSLFAQQFLKSEICSLGVKLLQKIRQLQKHSSVKNFWSVQRAVLVLQLHGVFNFLSQFGGYSHGLFAESEVDLIPSLSPLHIEKSMISSKNGENLQEKDTAIRVIRKILHKNFKSFHAGSAPNKIGWALVFLFLSRELIGELTWEVRTSSEPNSPWRAFFVELFNYKNKGFKDASMAARTFVDALKHRDPESQLVLIECLLFITCSCQIERGWFLTSKSSFSEFVFSKEAESYLYALSRTSSEAADWNSLGHLYDFILAVVLEFLSRRKFGLSEKSKMKKAFEFRQSLVLRLVIILGLLCLNSKEHFFKVGEVLSKYDGILTVLPHNFLLRLWGVSKGRIRTFNFFSYSFSKALEAIGNGLVVIHNDSYISTPFMYLKPSLIHSSSLFEDRKEIQVACFGKGGF